MANRILLGERSGQYGLWVSKPGFNVATTGPENMLFSSGEGALQALHTGAVTIPNNGAEVGANIPFVPYIPAVWMNLSPRAHEYVPDPRRPGERETEFFTPRYRKINDFRLGFSVYKFASDYTGVFTLHFTVFARPFNGQ